MDSQLYMLRAKKLGIKLTLARQKQNIALEDLAHKMGMHPDEINSFEKGITAPSLPQIQVLSSILQMQVTRKDGPIFSQSCNYRSRKLQRCLDSAER